MISSDGARGPRGDSPDVLEVAFRAAPCGLALLDADAAVRAVNPRLAAMLGCRAEALVGRSFPSLVDPDVHPDGCPDLVAAVTADLGAAARDGVPPSAGTRPPPVTGTGSRREACLRAADGSRVWALLRWAAAAPTPGGARLVVEVSEPPGDDETQDAVHELDAHMEHLGDASEFGVALINLEGRFLYVNQELCDLLGYSHPELMGRLVRDITHPEDWGKTQTYFAGMLEPDASRHQTIRRYVRKDGRLLYCRRAIYPGRGRDGAPRSILLVMEPGGVA